MMDDDTQAIEVNEVEIRKGVHLQYAEIKETTGTCAPLVFVHGYLDSWKTISRVFARLPRGCRMLSVTMRGWGESSKTGEYSVSAYAEDVMAFLDSLSIDRAILGGHSMGTLICTLVAARYPEKVAGLVLCGAGTTVDPSHVIDPTNQVTLQTLGDMMAAWPTKGETPEEVIAFLREFQLDDLNPYIKCGKVEEDFASQVMEETLKGDLRAYKEAWANMLLENHTEHLSNIRVPVLIIAGGSDAIFNRAEQSRLFAALESVPFIVYHNIEGAPHGMIWTHAEEVSQYIDNFMRMFGSQREAKL